ncbi:thaumatin-like protein 1b [Heracleum sosnowskyi]|uniref:Thaumatin-like protein 1b n=1 Tax=Heracleum sosnowskyi TaxID=360622 RepID=A0AAD8MZS2_9APIA|nr:thaumatin-like protein 1b [Heracleum sosnowskyi]
MTFRILFTLILVTSSILDCEATTFTITNNCQYTIWPATLTIHGNTPSLSGFELASHKSQTVVSERPWTWEGKIWARTYCNYAGTGCSTGDCGNLNCSNDATITPPATIILFNINVDVGKDEYAISLVDGFNLPVRVFPKGSGCLETNCPVDANAVCPNALAVRNDSNAIIGCKSACDALNQPQYCCTGAYAKNCKPTNYSEYFKSKCPHALSYPKDDRSNCFFTCPTGSDYIITFCP